jgi:DNA-directed RNA polymerase subunit RPC12/RpoP
VDYKFITTCGECGKEFMVFWVMDRSLVRPESVAEITCPVCGMRFYQSARGLLPYETRANDLFAGRPVRTVEIAYDCPHCGNSAVFVSLVHTDLPWEDLSREANQVAICNRAACPQRGLPQKLKPTRTQLGALNPGWE